MRFALILALLSCLVASSCGAASTQQAADETAVVAAPPIETIDEWAHPGFAYLCREAFEADEPCEPSPEGPIGELAQAIRPAKDSEPRKIARLRLTARGPKSEAFLIAWRNRADKLCLADLVGEDGSGGGGPFGPCLPEGFGRCDAICLTLKGSGQKPGVERRLRTIIGVVASKADALRITFDDGEVITYELAGPVVAGFPEYRVFMLDLGRRKPARLELLAKEKVIATWKIGEPA